MLLNEEARCKIGVVKLLMMDVDGVLTDGRTLCGTGGFEGVLFNVQDGTGIKWLHRAGIQTALISGRQLDAVTKQAEVLSIPHVIQGAKVKLDAYEQIKRQTGLDDEAICYVGDDLPDIPVMKRVGLSVAVRNARPEVLQVADIVTDADGGDGAVRELAECILKAKGKWDEIVTRYFQ